MVTTWYFVLVGGNGFPTREREGGKRTRLMFTRRACWLVVFQKQDFAKW
jgi:hypothetical protein